MQPGVLAVMRTAKAVLAGFQVERRTPLGIRLEAIPVTFGQRICLRLEDLSEAEFKRQGLISSAEQVPQQNSILVMAWLVLAAFPQVYSENQDLTVVQRD